MKDQSQKDDQVSSLEKQGEKVEKNNPTSENCQPTEEFFKATPPIDIHLAFENHISQILRQAKLPRQHYYKTTSEQLAAKETLIDAKKQLRYDLIFDEEKKHSKAPKGMWIYVASSLKTQ